MTIDPATDLRTALYEVAAYVRIDFPAQEPDLVVVLNLYRVLSASIDYLRDVRADLGEFAARLMPAREMTVAGIGSVKRETGNDRRGWDHDALFSVVLARSRDERILDEDSGEYEDPAAAFLRVLRDCMGTPGYWKVGDQEKGTGLRGRGLDPDEFCETVKKRPTVTLPRDARLDLADVGESLPDELNADG